MFQKLKIQKLKSFPVLKEEKPYNSQHVNVIIRIQRRFKAMLYRIRNDKEKQLSSLAQDNEPTSQRPITPENAAKSRDSLMEDELQAVEDEPDIAPPLNTVQSIRSLISESDIANPINSEQSQPNTPKMSQTMLTKIHPI